MFGDISQKLPGIYNTDKQVIITGDMSGSGYPPASISVTLNNVNSNVGTFGSTTQSVQVTVDAKGRITAISNQTIAGSISSNYNQEPIAYSYFGGV